MPTNDALIGNAAGYESLKFTEDGGFVVGGFTNYEGKIQNKIDLVVVLYSKKTFRVIAVDLYT